jgi:alkanesulfonate monooxygenase SsuD/methylene tetrahydromethanopterin reductase-like flavin-dependent oxidoreductase (luciferase family)
LVDYGHPLEFGTFITPVNNPPRAAVARAQLSERLGYDLVSFQDHPYQPAFHDTWTLLTWVAAQTERIGIAGNVLNVFGDPGKSGERWVQELLPLVLEGGVGTLILGSDDPAELRRFAAEVIPALRAAVARERDNVITP